MKARTKNQKVVVALDSKVKKIGKRVHNWAEKNVMYNLGHRYKSGTVNCLKCGNHWKSNFSQAWQEEVTGDKCPKCKSELKITSTMKRTNDQSAYYTVIEKAGDYQLIRTFQINSKLKCKEAAKYYHIECFRVYIRKDGKREVIARLRSGNGYYWGYWQGWMELRQPKVIENKYSDEGLLYPKWDIHKHVTQAGFDAYTYEENKYTACKLMWILLTCIHMETIDKTPGYNKLYKYCFHYPEQIQKYWATIKICIRNKYMIPEPRTYMDMIEALSYLKKDLRNRHFVCPDDLQEQHNFWIATATRVRRKHEEKLSKAKKLALIEKQAKEIDNFEKRMVKFADLKFEIKNLKILPLLYIDQVKSAGKELHHCIYQTTSYWQDENNLLLGAYLNDKLIETTQYSLSEKEVLHSYGLLNKHSVRHNTIVKTINKQKDKIYACLK